eukprot:8727537-Pyramimonas_sp.AAC.1
MSPRLLHGMRSLHQDGWAVDEVQQSPEIDVSYCIRRTSVASSSQVFSSHLNRWDGTPIIAWRSPHRSQPSAGLSWAASTWDQSNMARAEHRNGRTY